MHSIDTPGYVVDRNATYNFERQAIHPRPSKPPNGRAGPLRSASRIHPENRDSPNYESPVTNMCKP